MNELQTGSSYPAVRDKDVFNQPFPLPPKYIQQAIVSKIQELFSEIDKGIEQLKTAQQQLKAYRQAVLKWAFEGKLTNGNLEANELPDGWKWKPLKEVTTQLGDGLHGTPTYALDGEYYFINGNNLSDGRIIFKESTKKVDFNEYQKHKKNLGETTILVSINGTLGNTAFYNGEKIILGKSACYFNLNADADKRYIRYILASQRFLNYALDTATGSTIPNVSLKAMREFKIPIPSIEEQNQIVQEIESRLSIVDKMEGSINQSLQQVDVLRQSILKKAFEGKLVQTEAEPVLKVVVKDIPIERKILAGKIMHLLHDTPHFRSTKFQKVLFLTEHFAEVAYETNYLQETAGPYDREFTVAFRKEMREKDWFDEETLRGGSTRFLVGENVGSLIADYPKYFKEKREQIRFVLELMKDCNTHEAELIATLYAVWNNRIIQKKPVSIELLTEDFFGWSDRKEEVFLEQEIRERYEWMRKVELVPRGFGKTV